jgi:hypothetical protein
MRLGRNSHVDTGDTRSLTMQAIAWVKKSAQRNIDQLTILSSAPPSILAVLDMLSSLSSRYEQSTKATTIKDWISTVAAFVDDIETSAEVRRKDQPWTPPY